MEGDETIEEAHAREIREEMNTVIIITQVHHGYIYEYGSLKAQFIPISGSISPRDIHLSEHEEHTYVEVSEIGRFDVAPPDYGAVHLLQSSLITR